MLRDDPNESSAVNLLTCDDKHADTKRQFWAAKLAKSANYACSAFFGKYMKNYSRNDELCQKLCLHSLSKPIDDDP